MSAYVISIKLFHRERNEDNKYLIEASTKRYFRLAIPVFFSSLICFLLIKTNNMYNTTLAAHLGSGYKDGWLAQWFNFDPSIIHFLKVSVVEVFMPSNSNYNMAFWTMNPELMGSFLCFGLFAVIGRIKMRFLIYVCSCIFLTIAGLRDTICFYYLIFVLGLMWSDASNSSDEGIFLKEKIKKIFTSRLTAVGFLYVGFGVTIFSDTIYKLPVNLYYFFTFPVKAIGFTLLVNNFESIKKLLVIKPLIFLGKISFSFYLIHIPVMFSLGIYMYLHMGIESPYKTLTVFLILLAVTIILAYLFMKFVDEKSISISNKIGKYFSSNQRKKENGNL